jgi:hypothetical protein
MVSKLVIITIANGVYILGAVKFGGNCQAKVNDSANERRAFKIA